MIDPELGMNVVDLGLIYKIKVQKKKHPSTSLTGSRPDVTSGRVARARLRSSGVPADPDVTSGSGPVRKSNKVKILMTLTTPGCPLAAVFLPMIRQALSDIPDFNPYNDLQVEITFDPPWHPGLISQTAKAEMGLPD